MSGTRPATTPVLPRERRHEDGETDRRTGDGALPRQPAQRAWRTLYRRRLGDLRPRQRGRYRRGTARHPRPAADTAWSERTVHGPCGDLLYEAVAPPACDGGDVVDRTGCGQHGDGGGA